jgi:WD40 repeat protein
VRHRQIPNTALVVTCSSDVFIKIWDSQNDWRNTKTFPGHEHSVSAVRFMPGDQFIVSASRDKTIRIFNVATTFVSLLLPVPENMIDYFSLTLVILSVRLRDIRIGSGVCYHPTMEGYSRAARTITYLFIHPFHLREFPTQSRSYRLPAYGMPRLVNRKWNSEDTTMS